MRHVLSCFILGTVVGIGCLGQPDAETHPCEQSAHYIYDAQKGESNCEAGYT